MIKRFYSLTKPGIVYGNLITTGGGFLLASAGSINFILLLNTLIGLSCIIAAGCVFNNFIDRDIDKVMERTKNRVLVLGLIPIPQVILFAILLVLLGVSILYFTTSMVTVILATYGLFVYVVIYSLWLKRSSVYGTLIGSISGAIPPVAGYVAVTHHLDAAALILFMMLVFWQMAHSYAIAIYRLNDYTKAQIPVLPVKSGSIALTQFHILAYVVAFTLSSIMLSIMHYTGIFYLCITIILGIWWFILGVHGILRHQQNHKLWARKMFLRSVMILTILFITMAIDYVHHVPT